MSIRKRDKIKEYMKSMLELEDRTDIYDWLYSVGYDCNGLELNEVMATTRDDELMNLMIDTLIDNLDLKNK